VPTIFGVAREGVWLDHNLMRGPILIESNNFPLGFPRSDFQKINILHDGGSYFVVELQGSEEFITEYLGAEELCDSSLSGLLIKVKNYLQKSNVYEPRKIICEKLFELADQSVPDWENISQEDIDFLKNTLFNHKFDLVRLSKTEIDERNLRP